MSVFEDDTVAEARDLTHLDASLERTSSVQSITANSVLSLCHLATTASAETHRR
jgi:hypothetical protein